MITFAIVSYCSEDIPGDSSLLVESAISLL